MFSKETYLKVKRALVRIRVHGPMDKIFTSINRRLPLPLIKYDNVKVCLGFGVLHVMEEIELYYKFVKPMRGWIVMDGGAHVGIYTVEVAKTVGEEGIVVSVEPDPDNFKILCYNLRLNNLTNVIPIRAALGQDLGFTRLYRLGSLVNVISDVTKLEQVPSVVVPKITIDYIVYKLKLKSVDLLKLDVEGAEVEVVRGMNKVLPLHIVGEYHGVTRLNRLKELLSEKGYRVVHTQPSYRGRGIFYARHAR